MPEILTSDLHQALHDAGIDLSHYKALPAALARAGIDVVEDVVDMASAPTRKLTLAKCQQKAAQFVVTVADDGSHIPGTKAAATTTTDTAAPVSVTPASVSPVNVAPVSVTPASASPVNVAPVSIPPTSAAANVTPVTANVTAGAVSSFTCISCGAANVIRAPGEVWYVVTVGWDIGIYQCLDTVQSLVTRVPNNQYKKFRSEAKACLAFKKAYKAGLTSIYVPV